MELPWWIDSQDRTSRIHSRSWDRRFGQKHHIYIVQHRKGAALQYKLKYKGLNRRSVWASVLRQFNEFVILSLILKIFKIPGRFNCQVFFFFVKFTLLTIWKFFRKSENDSSHSMVSVIAYVMISKRNMQIAHVLIGWFLLSVKSVCEYPILC